MTHSESIANLAAALSAAQGEIAPVAFDRDNPFFHSRYATLTALREAMRPIFAAHGLSVVQGAGENGGIETTILHSSGEWLTSAGLPMRPVKDDPQGIGSLITYSRRYGLAAAGGLVADEDDDGNRATHEKPPSGAPAAPTPASVVQTAGTPETPANATESVNAGLSRKKGDAVTMTGNIQGDVTTATITVKEQPVEVAYFKIRTPEDGICYDVTAWHGARDQSMKFRDGDEVEVIGTWNYYKAVWKINANTVQQPLPF